MLLDSLSVTYENFRCAMEPRDDLLTPEDLKIKIMQEYKVKMNKHEEEVLNAMIAKPSYRKGKEPTQILIVISEFALHSATYIQCHLQDNGILTVERHLS